MVILIISVSLFGSSFETIDPLHAALKQNTVTKKIDTQVFISGRYFIGLTYDFVKFPTTLQLAVLESGSSDYGDINVATSGSSTVSLKVSYQYRLQISNLKDLYEKYGATGYHAQIITQSVEAIKKVAQLYTITDYFEKRRIISEAMHVECNKELADDFAVVELFQLREINPPAATETDIVNKIIAQQNVIIAEVEQESALVRAESAFYIAEAEADVVVINAIADREATLLIGNATASRITTHLNASAMAFQNLSNVMGYTTEQLLSHMMLEHVRTLDQSDAKLVVDMPTALFGLQ
jgi:regulator of protease activity HflC (stomatin/prohibitin superfamily)